MLTVALTGNVAAGKSAVALLWSEAGVPVVSADDLAREAVKPGTEGLSKVTEAFGPEVLAKDGSLDRAALRERIFLDPSERTRLEGILHPLIGDLRDRWMSGMRQAGALIAVAEIPLLFEAGLEGEFDAVVLVDAPEQVRLSRLQADRGLDGEEALRIMAAQGSAREKRPRAHFVLDNDGTREEMEERALALLDLLRAKARKASAS